MDYISPNVVVDRIFLDTGALQAFVDCAEFISGDSEFLPETRAQVMKRPDGADILAAMRNIFLFDERARFDWIISERSLKEIDAAKEGSWSGFARDVIDHADVCLMDRPPSELAERMSRLLEGREFGFLSKKDKMLLEDAVASECDIFLTLEKRLPRNAEAIFRRVPLLVVTPEALWEILKPHIRGL